MANYCGRSGAPMIQPTKDEIRGWLREAQAQLKEEKTRRQIAQRRLRLATEKPGELAMEGKIQIPAHRLGALVIDLLIEEENRPAEEAMERLSAEA